MELIVAVLIASAAFVYAPLLRVHAARRLRVAMPAGAVAPGAEAVAPPPVELHAAVEKWCAGWTDDWARDESRARARDLFAKHGDWNVVLQELERAS